MKDTGILGARGEPLMILNAARGPKHFIDKWANHSGILTLLASNYHGTEWRQSAKVTNNQSQNLILPILLATLSQLRKSSNYRQFQFYTNC